MQHMETATHETLTALNDNARRHAITMTGELTDIFGDRREGVRTLIDFMTNRLADNDVLVYAGRRGMLRADAAKHHTGQVASANWLASATLAASKAGSGLFVDVGSTTTDIALFANGQVTVRGYTDHERLRHEELVYTGVVRTPVAMLAPRLPFAGEWFPVMAEQFATMADVYRLTGELPEHADVLPSADGGVKTVDASARRLARMIGFDGDAAPLPAWRRMAGYLSGLQMQRILNASERALSRGFVESSAPIVGAGVGRFVVERLARRIHHPYMDFGSLLETAGAELRLLAGDCAPAVAVAEMARTWK
jgi:probable H4MPT-linked C1 transfer pathway protein